PVHRRAVGALEVVDPPAAKTAAAELGVAARHRLGDQADLRLGPAPDQPAAPPQSLLQDDPGMGDAPDAQYRPPGGFVSRRGPGWIEVLQHGKPMKHGACHDGTRFATPAAMARLHDKLARRIASRDATIGIMGVGYVGLPLALTFAEGGYAVLAFDVDATKVDALERGDTYIVH